MRQYQESIQVYPYLLPQVEEMLRLEGFSAGPQMWKPGQRSGWIKDLQGGYQLHVRLFNNGIIQAEHEVHWWYLEHPDTSSLAIRPMMEILDRHGIPYSVTYTEPYTANGHVPASRTPWLAVPAVLGLVALALLLLSSVSRR